jgi:hypothetical protein
MGKTSRYRPVNKKKYDREYDRIFGGRVICDNCGYMKRKGGICTKCFKENKSESE